MSGHDAELDQFRNGVSCAAVLERHSPAWRLDRKESTRRALKYRRSEGEIVIVNHDERGWWDPHSSAKGDVFDLVRFLEPGLNFGQVRKVLRPFIGLPPTYPEARRAAKRMVPDQPVAGRWNARPRLRRGSAVWSYLTGMRALPPSVLALADARNVVREGAYKSAWFAHHDSAGAVSHVEVRGPDYKGSLRGGSKALFRLSTGNPEPTRLAVMEAPIDALSLAALEGIRADTLYVATGGGIGPGSEQAIEHALAAMASLPGCHLASGTDVNLAGDRYAARHAEMAAKAGVAFARLRPPDGSDWNDVLRQRREA